MKTNQPSEKDVRVDRYVQNKMTGAERKAFEQEMHADSDMRSEVNLRTALRDGIKKQKNDSLRSRLRDIHQEVISAPRPEEKAIQPAGKSNTRWWLAAAASLAIIMAFTLWMSGALRGGPDDLYAQYYERPAYSGARGSMDAELAEAGNLYNEGRYGEAAYRFEDYLRSHTDNAYVRFMAAVSYLEADKPDNAKAHLQEVVGQDSPLSDRAAWYLALTYLKEENNREARFWLERLAKDAEAIPYSTQAEEILQSLD
ncbi:tol-pal system YbgF family protein [Roseivirga sp. BDSF3-8]|uniref:tetratricopeptide repeat protein n=1 Tax=Roseivirga sp. BDSF3-8 TaxID=3241598 RepID=UPI003531BEAB